MKGKFIFAFLAFIFMCYFIGCGKPARSSQTIPGGSAADFLNIPLTASDGKMIRLSQFKGKVVLVDFWATWCPPCRMEVPHLVDLYRQHHTKGLVIVGIDMDDNGKEAVKNFIEQFKVNYPIVLKNDAAIAAFGGIQGLPTKFILDKNGTIVEKRIGFQDVPKLFQEKIKPLL